MSTQSETDKEVLLKSGDLILLSASIFRTMTYGIVVGVNSYYRDDDVVVSERATYKMCYNVLFANSGQVLRVIVGYDLIQTVPKTSRESDVANVQAGCQVHT